jgi:hypothetical protein
MDKALVEAARELYAESLFETVRKCYCEANKDYIEKQLQIASEYLTDKQKEELRSKGINIKETIREAKILKAISETMICEKCPCDCRARENSSQANCVAHWAEMLSKINPSADWKEVRHEVERMVQAN